MLADLIHLLRRAKARTSKKEFYGVIQQVSLSIWRARAITSNPTSD